MIKPVIRHQVHLSFSDYTEEEIMDFMKDKSITELYPFTLNKKDGCTNLLITETFENEEIASKVQGHFLNVLTDFIFNPRIQP